MRPRKRPLVNRALLLLPRKNSYGGLKSIVWCYLTTTRRRRRQSKPASRLLKRERIAKKSGRSCSRFNEFVGDAADAQAYKQRLEAKSKAKADERLRKSAAADADQLELARLLCPICERLRQISEKAGAAGARFATISIKDEEFCFRGSNSQVRKTEQI